MPRPAHASQPADAPDFDLDRHPFFWMTQVISARAAQLAAVLKPYRMRAPEWRALAAIYGRKRCSMSELSDLSSIDRTTLSRTVDRMQRAGLLVRLSDAEDARVTRLSLTTRGEQLFGRIWPAVDRLNAAAQAGLPDGATDMLRWTLARMKANLDAAGQGAARLAGDAA